MSKIPTTEPGSVISYFRAKPELQHFWQLQRELRLVRELPVLTRQAGQRESVTPTGGRC